MYYKYLIFREIYGVILVTIGAILPFHRKTWNKDFQTTVFSVLKIFAIPFVFMAILEKALTF